MSDVPYGYGVWRDPESYTFDAFVHAFYEECKAAWDDGRSRVAVTLPEGVFPGLSEVQNPVTREIIKITRVPAFTREPAS